MSAKIISGKKLSKAECAAILGRKLSKAQGKPYQADLHDALALKTFDVDQISKGTGIGYSEKSAKAGKV